MSEYDCEPVPGLPEHLPAGERILWQGAPDWRCVARRVFLVRLIAAYFAALASWLGAVTLYDGGPLSAAAKAALWPTLLGLAAIGILALIAWLIGRTTVYTVTNRRLVMRFGIAMPMTVNIPFRLIDSAAVKTRRDGSGDIPLTLTGSERIGYAILWPHARPWKLARPQPMLRAIPDARSVAAILARALADAQRRPAAAPERARDRTPQGVEHPPLAAAS